MPCDPADLARKARRIRLLLFDVDGVLTDGQIRLQADGSESKQFSIRDGTGIVWAQHAGLSVGILSGRHSPATTLRAAQLGIRIVRQSAVEKQKVFAEILDQERLQADQAAFMGDDLLDLPVLLGAGLSAAPADAVPEVLERVDWVSGRAGGDGAARQLIELVLRAQEKWDGLVRSYAPHPPDERL